MPQDYLDALSIGQRRIAWTSIFGDTDWPSTGILVLIDDGAIVGPRTSARVATMTRRVRGQTHAIYLRHRRGVKAADTSHDGGAPALTQAAFTAATLWVLDSNDRARRFYELGGWQWDGTDKLDVIGGRRIRELRYRRLSPSPAPVARFSEVLPASVSERSKL